MHDLKKRKINEIHNFFFEIFNTLSKITTLKLQNVIGLLPIHSFDRQST